MDKRNTMNYRSIYKNLICDIPKGFDIHHLDYERNNNSIDNLLMLPKKTHNEWHQITSRIAFKEREYKILKSSIDIGNGYIQYHMEMINEHWRIYMECRKWLDYKLYCQGYIGNIHNIKLGGSHES